MVDVEAELCGLGGDARTISLVTVSTANDDLPHTRHHRTLAVDLGPLSRSLALLNFIHKC